MSLEDYRNSIPPALILPLKPDSKGSAAYVKTRTNSTWRASTAEAVTAGGVVRMNISSELGWLAPETTRLMFTINNLAPAGQVTADTLDGWAIHGPPVNLASVWVHHDLQPAGSAACFISRIRVMVGGVLVEDVDHYGRLHEMLSILEPEDKLLNEGVSDISSIPVGGSFANKSFKQVIEGGQSRTVSISLKALGLFSTLRHIPLKYAPITLEISIAPASIALAQGDIALRGVNESDAHPMVPQVMSINETLTSVDRAIRRSQSFNLTNWQLKADLVTLDSSIDEQFAEQMINGSYDLTFPSLTTDSTTSLAYVENPTLTMSRVLTSIRSVYVTFFEGGNTTRFNDDATLRQYCNQHYTEANMFSTPKPHNRNAMAVGCWSSGSDDGDYEGQLAIGSSLWPDYPMQTAAEMYQSLNRAMGTLSSDSSISIRPQEFRSGERHVLAFQLEKSPQFAVYTGVSTKTGELIQVRLNKMTNNDTRLDNNRKAVTKAFMSLEFDMIVRIRASGVSVES